MAGSSFEPRDDRQLAADVERAHPDLNEARRINRKWKAIRKSVMAVGAKLT